MFVDNMDSMYPTLMHFGAHYNLKEFCRVLVDNPFTCTDAIQKDRFGRFPGDIARGEGHLWLADALQRVTGHLMLSKYTKA